MVESTIQYKIQRLISFDLDGLLFFCCTVCNIAGIWLSAMEEGNSCTSSPQKISSHSSLLRVLGPCMFLTVYVIISSPHRSPGQTSRKV